MINCLFFNHQGYETAFPENIVDEINEMKQLYGASDEMAIAFILEKYNVGVALERQDANGNFKTLNTDEGQDGAGIKTYIPNNCQ